MTTKAGARFVDLANQARSRVRELEPPVVHAMAKHVVLIDVREPEEVGAGHIPGAIPISRGLVERQIEEVIPILDATLVCYCSDGYRSALAVENLQKMGYTNAFTLAGGIEAWFRLGLPIEAAAPPAEREHPAVVVKSPGRRRSSDDS